MEKQRLIHFDLLRILACFSVIMLHSAAQFWYILPMDSFDWWVVHSYNSMVRFGVPVFVAISGALFLAPTREISIRKLYTRNILRMILLYVVWSVIYGIFDCCNWEGVPVTFDGLLFEIFQGRYHLWYIPMIIGLYMLLPILKRWVDNAPKKEIQYFLVIFLIFKVGKTTLLSLETSEIISFVSGIFVVEELLGYIGYFILGYYVAHYGIEAKWHKWAYLGGVAGVCANIILSGYKSLQTGTPDGVIFDSFGFFTFLVVLALLVFFTQRVSLLQLSERGAGIVKEISLDTLGIYLMHLICLEFLQGKGIHSTMLPPIIGVPLIAVVCFGFCLLCTALLRRIPIVGKYIC